MHENQERPLPHRGPLKFVDNTTGKRRTDFLRKCGKLGSWFRELGERGDVSSAPQDGTGVKSHEETSLDATNARTKPKAADSTSTNEKDSNKENQMASTASKGPAVSSACDGEKQVVASSSNALGWAMVILVLLIVVSMMAYTNDSIRGKSIAELFPDQSLQVYIGERVDSDGDGRLSDGEILSVRELDGFQDRGIRSLAGLEMFSNLERLDVSGAGAEEMFRVHSRQWSLFGRETTRDEIRTHFLENLKSLNLSDNELSGKLYFRDSCPNLVDLNIANNKLEYLEFADGVTLESLDCSNNEFEGGLYLKPGIKNLNCAGNRLVQIVITSRLFESNGPLDSLYCQDNRLVSMLDGNNPFPYDIKVVSMDKVDISNNPGIWIDTVREDGVVEIGYAKLNP